MTSRNGLNSRNIFTVHDGQNVVAEQKSSVLTRRCSDHIYGHVTCSALPKKNLLVWTEKDSKDLVSRALFYWMSIECKNYTDELSRQECKIHSK